MEFFFIKKLNLVLKNENTWVNDFNCPVFFSHGAPSACGVLIAQRFLTLDIILDADQYILINLYNANTEAGQVNILEELQSMLKNLQLFIKY